MTEITSVAKALTAEQARTLRLGLLLDPADSTFCEATDAAPADPADLLRLLTIHKVAFAARVRAQRLSPHEALKPQGAGRTWLAQALRDVKPPLDPRPTWAELAIAHARVGGYRPVAVKGLAARSWYPDPGLRHLGDLDVWVPTGAEAMRLSDALTQVGWTAELLRTPGSAGSVQLTTRMPGRLMIDIQYGPLFPTHSPDQMEVLDGGTPWQCSEHFLTLLTILAAVADRGNVIVKDVNDLIMASALPASVWRQVAARLDTSGLRGAAAAVADSMSALARPEMGSDLRRLLKT